MSEQIAREFLTRVLDRDPLQDTDIATLLALPESHFLDFKGGPFNPREGARTLRRYLSGFANADGGVLIFGIADAPRPRPLVGVGWMPNSPEDWVNRATEALLPTMGAAPACQVVPMQGHQVVVVGVDRGSSLTPCIEGGDSTYYIRSGDSTFEMRESLLADLILGRRKGPTMEIVKAYIDCDFAPNQMCELHMGLHLENHSFGFASDLTVGLVTWALERGQYTKPNAELVRAIKPVPATLVPEYGGWTLSQLRPVRGTEDPVVRPFGLRVQIPFSQSLRVPNRPAQLGVAIFVAPRDCPTQWFQGSLDWHPLTAPGRVTRNLEIERLHRRRPEVKWEIL